MEVLALLMFAALVAMLLLGFPVAFTLGAVAMLFGLPALGLEFFDLLPLRIWGIVKNFTLLAVPLFIFMGVVLQKSGIAEDLLETMALLFGRVRGGLTISIVVVGGLLAATTGVVGATVVTMAVIALPAMLKHGYKPELSSGVIAASGTLGQLIPPSIVLVLLGDVVGVPVGRLFAGAVVPGLLLITGFIIYIAFYAARNPDAAPVPDVSLMRGDADAHLAIRVVKSLLPPLMLVFAVLGSIFFGMASPTESAAFGALGALILAAIHKRLNKENLLGAARNTTRHTSMVFLILVGATAFGLVFRGLGGRCTGAQHHDITTGRSLGVSCRQYAGDFYTGFLSRFSRDQFHRRTHPGPDCAEYGYRSSLVYDINRGQSANLVPDTALWFLAVLFKGRSAERN